MIGENQLRCLPGRRRTAKGGSRMPTDVTEFENQQELRVGVSGPGGANRLFIMSGIAVVDFPPGAAAPSTTLGVPASEVFRFFLGPKLESKEFHRAVATASPSSVAMAHTLVWRIGRWLVPSGEPGEAYTLDSAPGVDIARVDADWDDKTKQVEVRIEVAVTDYWLKAISYHVDVLA